MCMFSHDWRPGFADCSGGFYDEGQCECRKCHAKASHSWRQVGSTQRFVEAQKQTKGSEARAAHHVTYVEFECTRCGETKTETKRW